MARQKTLRRTLKDQRDYRNEERRRHAEDLAEWILKRGPVGPKMTRDVGLAPGRRV